MASFVELREDFLPNDGDWYKVNGPITEEDIIKINSLPRKTILVIENTKGISSNIISKITSNNISFSVVGGLDYFNKEKYKNKEYVLRTMMSPTGLTAAIKYFEGIEALLSPEWSDTQKCMFLYDALTRDFTYEKDYETKISRGIAERSLNGILYKKLVCSGFALVLKEVLDRNSINNVYQNRKGHHSWNIVELDGKLRGLELTWDCSNKSADNKCRFKYFGQDKNFYENKSHALSREIVDIDWDFDRESTKTTIYEEETQFDLTPFSIEELRENYRIIAPTINARKAQNNPLFNSSEEEMKMLPIDSNRIAYQKQCEVERYFILLYQFLKNSNQLDIEYNFLNLRRAFTSDILSTLTSGFILSNTSSFNGNDIGIAALANCEFSTDGDFITPFGIKNSISNIEYIMDENAMDMVFTQLKQRLHEYSFGYLLDLLNNSENMLSKYDQLQSLTIQKDFNLSMVVSDLYTKLQALIISKDILISFGISQEIINQKISQIETYFESFKQSSITEEEQKERDIDFLYSFFGDTKEVKHLCEQHDGHLFTDEEWQQKCRNVEYIMQVFDKLDIKQEYIQLVLDDIFGDTYYSSANNVMDRDEKKM